MPEHCSPLPALPLPENEEWTRQLTEIAQHPLEFCPEFPEIAQRFEAWWNCASFGRPIFLGAAVDPSGGRRVSRRLDLIDDTDAWFEARFADLRVTRFVGDAVPSIRADFGPVLLGSLFGGSREFGADTGWTHAFIDDAWSNEPDWQLREDNAWWERLCALSERVAQEGTGRFLGCTPDLGGSGDVLLNLRGSSELCLDVITAPERVRAAVDAMYPAWHRATHELYRIALAKNTGLVHWLGLWSNTPYNVPACDFNFMIGHEAFNALFLPDIARQAATTPRAIFHLDGPGAARHIDALLEVPGLHIQFTPGAGTPSVFPWIDMFKKIQARGRALLVITQPNEVLELTRALRPEGLGILLDNPPAPDGLEALFQSLCRECGV